MLEKNGYKVDFKKEKLTVKEIVGNKQSVTFQLVNSLSKVNPKTGKRTYKRRHLLEAAYVSNDEDGNSTEWRFYKSKNQKGKNGVDETKYTPEFLTIEQNGALTIQLGPNQSENIDLFWFFYYHPRRANNKNGDGSRRPLFYMIDENAEAMEYAQKKHASSEMEKLLWNEKDRLADEELINIAKALRVPGVADMNIERVQLEIEKLCKNNPNRFLALKGGNKETEMRAAIQDATEKGFLLLNRKNEWEMIDGEITATLCNVRKTDDPITTLVHFFKNIDDNDHYGRIKEMITAPKKAFVKSK